MIPNEELIYTHSSGAKTALRYQPASGVSETAHSLAPSSVNLLFRHKWRTPPQHVYNFILFGELQNYFILPNTM